MTDAREPRTISKAAAGAVGGAVGLVGRAMGSAVGSVLRLPGLHRAPGHPRRPGASPGIERAPGVDQPPEAGVVRIRCIDYGPERCEAREVDDLAALLTTPRPEWAAVRWIDVTGLHAYTINRLRQAHPFHTLAAEDVLHVPQRSKVEAYEGHLFVVVHMLTLAEALLVDEQVSAVLFPDTLITFQERTGDVWEPIRERIGNAGSRLRNNGPDLLLYALLDAIVDHLFPILERYGDVLEEVEVALVEAPDQDELRRLHGIKRDLLVLRRAAWPLRQVVDDLHRGEHGLVRETTRTYLRDVYDHALQVLDIVETYREMTGGLTDLYMSAVSNRMNEIMKVLTILASLFIPVTFLAGVYGMNFEHIPELGWRYAYPTFWALCVLTTIGLLVFFRRKGWLGG